MPETGSPPEDEQENTRSVSPLSFLLASRCSTPGISSLDGSPRYLFALPPPPPRPRSASPLGMAIKPHKHENLGHQERRTKVKSISTQTSGLQEPASGQPEALPSRESAVQSRTADPFFSWNDLSKLYRLEKYQAKKCKQVQRQLHQIQSVAARTSRLVYTARSVQRTLAECIKAEDKHSFVNLFNALRDALDGTETTGIYNHAKGAENHANVTYPSSFIDALPAGSGGVVLDFLARVRHDGDFVADRLTALTQKELVSLLPEKGQPRSAESIFGSSPRTSSRTSRHLGFVADGQTELLSSFEYASPLEALVLSVRGVAHPGLASDPVATDVWSTVCARLISEQKPGYERFVPSIINMWALSSSWPGKEQLSMWISRVLQDGSFLLEQTNKQSFRVRTQGLPDLNVDEEARTAQYYSNSVNSLLGLLGDRNGASVIPEGALELCQAICQKFQSCQHHQAFPNFVLTRWLFSSFLPEAMTLPEIHGLMTDRFISDNTRKQVLREIAGRAQKMVFDVVYSWKHGTTVSAESADIVHNVASRFQIPRPQDETSSASDILHSPKSSDGTTFVPVCIADVNAIVSALCPRRRMDSISSEFDSSHGGLQSSASSISGLSLFQSPGSIEAGYRIPLPWTHEFQSSMISESTSTLSSEDVRSDGRVDSVLQPDWQSDQLLEACASIEDYMSDASSVGSSSWCVLLARADGSLRALKEELLDGAESKSPSDRASVGDSAQLADLQKCRETVEELLLSGDVKPHSNGGEDYLARDPRHLIVACQLALERRITDSEQDSDFVAAHSWFRKRRNFNALVAGENGSSLFLLVLTDIKLDKERSVSQTHKLMDLCDTWIRSLKPAFELYGKELQMRSDTVGRLRDKMWYVAEVRPSAAYEEVRLIASALKVMGRPKQPPRTRLAPPLRHWSGSKMPSSSMHMKTEAQILEILTTPIDYGGPNKLSDDQCKALSLWMERNTVENLCVGEERIHKLCMEIRKAVDQITIETSPLLSSTLLARDKATSPPQRRDSLSNPFWPIQVVSGRFDLLKLQTNVPRSIDSLSSASSHQLSARSSRDHLEARSPAMTSRSSAPFWSPVMTEARTPSSATSVGSSQTHAAGGHYERDPNLQAKTSDQNLVDQLRRQTVSLLLSELATMTFGEGSETDRAFWTGLGGDLTGKHLLSLRQNVVMSAHDPTSDEQFDFDQSFQVIARRFEGTCNPFRKLDHLLDMDTLLVPYMAEQADAVISRAESKLNTASLQKLKRQGSSQTNIKVQGFRRLLFDPNIRPAAIFRDLQYIAALVPSSVLESTPQGKAFWNVAVAISSLKQEVRQFMVETADGIISYHSNNRGHARAASIAQQERDFATFSVPSRTPSAEDIKRYTMADAAYLLQITAKEGDAAAQRELATLYLTHPELMDHIIAPFSRPRDVFREELESKWRKNQDPNRCDPTTMCVAHHWMSMSSKGGDALAKEYLRQREEMDRLG